eukprot:CAMPEP_0201610904 /NCGR_PEP_ID=MMETSP0492-20130828/18349_1 /ASSEMBLY_ACC=CAM_ASM_000837 /TAXON_ID=420259 /ORGANISM="Thalassiosira gravida, Strain GMp14c1" /LENGTH=91 /DNA_ID=CAMNT_0048076887 /DNA_START=133 /DNA_END=408 /DNA_ORIENTATION=-
MASPLLRLAVCPSSALPLLGLDLFSLLLVGLLPLLGLILFSLLLLVGLPLISVTIASSLSGLEPDLTGLDLKSEEFWVFGESFETSVSGEL